MSNLQRGDMSRDTSPLFLHGGRRERGGEFESVRSELDVKPKRRRAAAVQGAAQNTDVLPDIQTARTLRTETARGPGRHPVALLPGGYRG